MSNLVQKTIDLLFPACVNLEVSFKPVAIISEPKGDPLASCGSRVSTNKLMAVSIHAQEPLPDEAIIITMEVCQHTDASMAIGGWMEIFANREVLQRLDVMALKLYSNVV